MIRECCHPHLPKAEDPGTPWNIVTTDGLQQKDHMEGLVHETSTFLLKLKRHRNLRKTQQSMQNAKI